MKEANGFMSIEGIKGLLRFPGLISIYKSVGKIYFIVDRGQPYEEGGTYSAGRDNIIINPKSL